MPMTLKALRVNMGLSREQAANHLNISPFTLGNWENAKTFPNVPQIKKIEEFYGTTYDDIIFLPSDFSLTEANKLK